MKKVALGILVILVLFAYNCGGPVYRDCIDECYDRSEDCHGEASSESEVEDCSKEFQECTDWCASGCANPPEKDWN